MKKKGLKFNPLKNNIENKKIILIDDSIVRGNTIDHLVKIINSANPKELHILIGSPEIRFPCYMGIDMKSTDEFIMNKYSATSCKGNRSRFTTFFKY